MSIDDSDVYYCYQDLWKTAQERENAVYHGIDTSNNRNVTKCRIGDGDKVDSVALAFSGSNYLFSKLG